VELAEAKCQRVAARCSASQRGAACCSVLQPHLPWGRRRLNLSACHSVIQCVTVRYSVLQCVAVCCSRTFCKGVGGQVSVHVTVRSSVLQYITVCCRVLQPQLSWGCRRLNLSTCHNVIQCETVCCSVLQCVAVCCSVAACCSRSFREGVGGQVSVQVTV